MTRPIIGLVGRKRVGKDTVAARLVEQHGFVRYAFADRLRDALLTADPLVPDTNPRGSAEPPWRTSHVPISDYVSAFGWEEAKGNPEVRRLLQHYGMAIREIDPEFWVRPVLAAITADSAPAVITDVRFRNEAEAIERLGGYLVRVTRPGLDESDTHPSETELAYYPTADHLINRGTIVDLHECIDTMVPWLG